MERPPCGRKQYEPAEAPHIGAYAAIPNSPSLLGGVADRLFPYRVAVPAGITTGR